LKYRGSFLCNDEELNRIWDVGAYTLHLTSRETFIDGIKRDRWAWSGDALQSYLMNYYLFFDQEAVKRTAWLLRGKDPVYCHINTILDYTFTGSWAFMDYYLYTGDAVFLEQIYPRMQSMMEFVLSRTNANGMVKVSRRLGVYRWTDGPLDKSGEISFEQMLFCKSLETLTLCAGLVDQKADQEKYWKLASDLRAKLEPTFWNDEKKAFGQQRGSG
jgi:glycogen debranching enzyme